MHISPQRLSTIKAVPGITPEKSLSDTLSEFLKKNYKWEKFGEPSWRLIVTAIAHRAGGDDPALALQIAKNHPTGVATINIFGKCVVSVPGLPCYTYIICRKNCFLPMYVHSRRPDTYLVYYRFYMYQALSCTSYLYHSCVGTAMRYNTHVPHFK